MMSKGICTGENKYAESRVYVACLGCYNEGRLTGKTMTSNELSEALEKANDYDGDEWHLHLHGCNQPDHDEWAIHDYDGDIARVMSSEHPDLQDLIWMMDFIDTQTNAVPAVQLAWGIHNIPTPDDIEHVYENMEIIEDIADWAYETCKDCGYFEEPNGWHPINYIDWERVGNDMLMDYHYQQYGSYTYAIHSMA